MSRLSVALCAVLCCALLPLPSLAALLGIDFGSEFVKVALVAPGSPFEIVLDKHTKRKSPNMVAFDLDERQFGNGATTLSVRQPTRTFGFATRLLGKSADSASVQSLLERDGFPYELIVDEERDSLSFKFDDATTYSSEEIAGMVLQFVKRLASENHNIKDVVITVPSMWAQTERRALLDAAELAGLNVLSLINENAAAALQFGLDKQYELNKTEHTIFYNMGATHTEVSLVRYSSFAKKVKKADKAIGQVEVVAVAFDETLGGTAFDSILVDLLVDEAKVQLKKALGQDVDIRGTHKIMAKLRRAAKKAKHVLNTNLGVPVNIEGLWQDVDLRSHLTRDIFDKAAEALYARAMVPLLSVMEQTGLEASDITELVPFGGSSRLRKVKSALEQFLGDDRELAQNLNTDEAAALGAAYRAANISTTFRVRPIGFKDVYPYPMGIRLHDLPRTAEEEAALPEDHQAFTKRASLFNRNNALRKRKSVAFKHDDDFQITMHHDSAQLLPQGAKAQIAVFNVTGVPASIKKFAELGKPKVSLTFYLSASGIVDLVKADAQFTEMVKVEAPKKKANETATADDASSSNSTDNDANSTTSATTEEEAPEKDGDSPDAATDSDAATAASDDDSAEEEDTAEPEFVMKKKVHKFELTISREIVGVRPMTAAQTIDAQSVLAQLDERDQFTAAIHKSKNEVESYIYEARDRMYDEDVELVSTEEQRDEFRVQLTEAEDWLYDDESEDTPSKFQTKLDSLLAVGKPIFDRASEYSARPKAIKAAKKHFETDQEVCEFVRTNMTWVSEDDVKRFEIRVGVTEQWLADKKQEQDKLELYEAPVLVSRQIYRRLDELSSLGKALTKQRKPIEKKSKKKKAKKSKKNSTDDNDDIDDDETTSAKDDSEETSAKDETEDETTTEDETEKTAEDETEETAEEEETTEEDSQDDEEHETKDEL